MFRLLLLLLWLAQGADIATTVIGLRAGCVEMNPLYHGHSEVAMVAIKGAVTLLISLLAWGERRWGSPRMARIMLLVGINIGAWAAAWNVLVIPSC